MRSPSWLLADVIAESVELPQDLVQLGGFLQNPVDSVGVALQTLHPSELVDRVVKLIEAAFDFSESLGGFG